MAILNKTHVNMNNETRPCSATVRNCAYSESDMLLSKEDMDRSNELMYQIEHSGNFGQSKKEDIAKMSEEYDAIITKGRARYAEEEAKDNLDVFGRMKTQQEDRIDIPERFDDPSYQNIRQNVEDEINDFLDKKIFHKEQGVYDSRKHKKARDNESLRKEIMPGKREYGDFLNSLKETITEDLKELERYSSLYPTEIAAMKQRSKELDRIIEKSDKLSKLNKRIEFEKARRADNNSEYDDPISLETPELFTNLVKRFKKKK